METESFPLLKNCKNESDYATIPINENDKNSLARLGSNQCCCDSCGTTCLGFNVIAFVDCLQCFGSVLSSIR